jgi:hypothetical protein
MNDGWFKLWIDGALAGHLTGLDNDETVIDAARFGAMTVKVGASGTQFIDEIETWRPVRGGP